MKHTLTALGDKAAESSTAVMGAVCLYSMEERNVQANSLPDCAQENGCSDGYLVIQEIYEKLEEQEKEINSLRKPVNYLKERMDDNGKGV